MIDPRVIVILTILVAPSLAANAIAQQEETLPPSWWGPTGEDGWHGRVAVVVHNIRPHVVNNAPVRWEMNVATLLADAGWPTRQVGDLVMARGFTLDPESWRVIEYTNFLPPTRAGDGVPKPFDVTIEGSDRFVIPSAFHRGTNEAKTRGPYDNATNPVGVLTWIAPGETKPGEARSFYIYFDRQEAGERPAANFRDAGLGRLQGDHYISRGNLLFGYGSSVNVTATEPNTEISVHVYTSSSRIEPHEPSSRSSVPNPFDLTAGSSIEYTLGPRPIPFVIKATKPVIAQAGTEGFVPALDDGLAGTSFSFQAVGNAAYLIGNQAGTRVQVTVDGRTSTLTLSPWATVVTAPGDAVSAHLVAGGPFLVQDAGRTNARAAILVPTLNGAPAGFAHTAASASISSARGEFRITAPQELAAVRVLSIERGVQIEPPGTPEEPFPPARDVPPGTPWVRSFASTDPTTAISYEAHKERGPVFVYAGRSQNGLRSAVGGLDARVFDVPYAGAFSAFAYYNDTLITIRVQGSEASSLKLNALNRFDFQTDKAYRIESTKPIALLPRSSIGYLPGRIDSLPLEVQRTEVRGAAVSLRSLDSDAEPVLRGAGPGTSVMFQFRAENLGRDASGPLTDTLVFSVEGPSLPWDVTVEPPQATLKSGEAAAFSVIVEVPPTGLVGTDLRFAVRATSSVNPKVHDELRAIVVTRTIHDVALAFEEAGGPKSLASSRHPGQGLNLTVAITNRGSAEDTFDLNITTTSADFTATLTENNDTPVKDITLAQGTTATLTLGVATPLVTRSPLVTIEVTAQSRASSAATDKLRLTVELREEGAIRLETDELIVFAAPGKNATINVSIINDGNLPATLGFGHTTLTPAGWPQPRILYRNAELSEINDLPPSRLGGPFNLTIEAPIPENATAFTAARILFQVEEREMDGRRTPIDAVELLALARRTMDFSLEGDTNVVLPPGRSQTLTYDLRNEGNGEENITLALTGLPAGWITTPAPSTDIAPGANAIVHLSLQTPAFTPPQHRAGFIEVRTQTEGLTTFALNITVPEEARITARLPNDQRALAGLPYSFAIGLSNEGNSMAPVRVNISPPSGWTAPAIGDIDAPPGAHRSITMTLTPPPEASGDFEIPVELSHGTTTISLPLRMQVEIPTPKLGNILYAPDISELPARTPYLVSLLVENPGQVDLPRVEVDLRVNGATVDRVTIESLPAGSSRIATLKATLVDRPLTIEVVLDPRAIFPALSPEERTLLIATVDKASVGAPNLVVALVLAAILYVAVRRRRS